MPLEFNQILTAIFFLMPGFIADRILTFRIPRGKRDKTVLLLDILFFSFLDYAILSPLVIALLQTQLSKTRLFVLSGWFLILLLFPILIGFSVAWFVKKKKLYDALGFISAIPTAWDSYFSEAQPSWVIVTFQDGSQLAGLFGLNSFASSSEERQDLYLEALWTLSKDGKLVKRAPGTGGGRVDMKGAKSLEFIRFA